jgi:hypothetical protein
MDDQNRHNATAILPGSAGMGTMAVTKVTAIVIVGIYPTFPGVCLLRRIALADVRLRDDRPF